MITESSNIVAVFYPPYAGGKFVINCLGFSERCCPSIQITKDSNSQFYPVEYYLEQKIPTMMRTVPDTIDECQNWLHFELSCGDFWGNNAEKIRTTKIPAPTLEIIKDHLAFFVVHNPQVLADLKQYIPKLRTMQLVNYDRFRQQALEIKTKPDDPNRSYVTYKNPNLTDFNFNMDLIYDWNLFYAEIVRCCEWLGIPAEFDSQLETYYQRYIRLHQ